ncbi:MAG: DNA recombination protein RmuC [Thermicanus sp.]|nr:DNA recombination protein RmuC [Thermicanus sp.]
MTHLREEMLRTQKEGREELSAHLASQLQTEIRLLESFSNQLTELTRLNDEKMERIRGTVEGQLTSLREENGKKLEEMRQTVDEKLQSTLEKRLGESFRLVSERLELVHKGLGEMQTLALGVGDLKKVLTNVKTRGTLGEIQLEALLEQILSPEQYEKNVAPRKGSGERVEFVVKLPGKKGENEGTVFLPIDAKFPLEDYQRLQEAEERGDATKTQEALKHLEARIRQEAKRIQEKYISPPDTTDFALLFLPVEGLYAEVLRRPGLWEELQRVYRVVITGPTTLTALLNSLQMGFRTLAIQKRSSEVWQLLGAVKTEFHRFGTILEKTQKKIQEASNTIEDAAKKSRTIERKLSSVEALPEEEVPTLLEEAEVS